jgi:hypothetical protein
MKIEVLKIRFSFTEVLEVKLDFWGVEKIHGRWKENSSDF